MIGPGNRPWADKINQRERQQRASQTPSTSPLAFAFVAAVLAGAFVLAGTEIMR
ncbi:MAG: hypothetical protein K8U57_07415 [Planctomycetes bacterium]|nr:hypothetical protein [Planctomycetota bacterium]